MSETSQLSQVFSKGAGAGVGTGAGAGAGAGRWESCTAPKSGLVELGNWCNAKIVQVSCVEACVLRLPSSGLYGFSCLVVVVASAGQDVLLDLNGQQVRSCLDGQSTFDNQTLLVSPMVGTRLEFRCDGQSWFVHSDYAKSLPVAATNGDVYRVQMGVNANAQTNLFSPISNSRHIYVQMDLNIVTKGKIYKIVNAQSATFTTRATGTSESIQPLGPRTINFSSIQNANDGSVSSRNSWTRNFKFLGTGADQCAVGDSFMIVYNGSTWYLCGSSFGKVFVDFEEP